MKQHKWHEILGLGKLTKKQLLIKLQKIVDKANKEDGYTIPIVTIQKLLDEA